jgi:RNA-directed DNA polymerase
VIRQPCHHADGLQLLVRRAIVDRMAEVGPGCIQPKPKIVYCKDANRHGSHEHTAFTFLGYPFRAGAARDSKGEVFTSFLPAISTQASKRLSRTVRRWRLRRRTEPSFAISPR